MIHRNPPPVPLRTIDPLQMIDPLRTIDPLQMIDPLRTIDPLQAIDPALQTAIFWVLAVVVAGLGLAITIIAYRGYRRNRSRPMLFIAIGFGLIVFPQIAIGLLSAVIDVGQFAVQTVSQLSNLVGLACILYAITRNR